MKAIREQIKEKGLKITWLAKQLGIFQPVLSMYLHETREMPSEIKIKLKDLLK
jgi:predicted transcriptional regulator